MQRCCVRSDRCWQGERYLVVIILSRISPSTSPLNNCSPFVCLCLSSCVCFFSVLVRQSLSVLFLYILYVCPLSVRHSVYPTLSLSWLAVSVFSSKLVRQPLSVRHSVCPTLSMSLSRCVCLFLYICTSVPCLSLPLYLYVSPLSVSSLYLYVCPCLSAILSVCPTLYPPVYIPSQ